ncbi:MAG: lipoprotein-releasing ABC transporter permease subunit [Gammaproteobacteria bacterium]|jgi:lipoprotein-releasing system permease protein|nr:lipoprotein-releasing ABC transporter permease subunit [Gammaproteobacteria bacterium]
MFTPVEAFIGWRYTRARRRSRFVSLISAISIGGVALGIASLITILSIMNGFERELRERMLGMSAHLTIDSEQGFLLDDARLDAAIAGAPGVMAVAPFITAEALLTQAGDVQGVRIVGVDPSAESAVTEVPRLMREGEFTALAPGSFGIVLGRGLANTLRVELGARVTLVLPEPMRTAVGVLPRLKAFTVVGIFEAGVQEYDEATAFVALADAARVFRTGGRMSGWRVRVSDPFAAPTVAGSLQPLLPALRIRDWTTLHTNLFRALQTEKIVMFVIMLLSVAVAAFNLVSTLVMVVGEKQSEIAVLATLGMTPARILRIFMTQGAIIGLAGVSVGCVLGVALGLHVEEIVSTIERVFQFHILSPDVYYISRIPAELETADVVTAALVATLLCLIAPVYPAWRASRIRPAEALRHE